ncbi:hypothetical protein [Streptomyces sp. NBC_01508]|uniref:hypothetical protein n=1 Tax=Streptomyces sp. NBC_01508 TaxID=2903888 RepID=UPI00386AD4B0
MFDTRDDFYVKNPETVDATMILAGLGVVWAMPVLLLISGLGSWHSVRKRGAAGFAVERLLRLGVPLVFATLTIIPVPRWLRAAAAGRRSRLPRVVSALPAPIPRCTAGMGRVSLRGAGRAFPRRAICGSWCCC